jgi:DNA-binding transcriptional regulator YbjK
VATLGRIAARRKHNAAERRRELADAALELLGSDGVHGVSHPKVDAHAGVPAGTTSFYFRTRKALLQAIATRLAERDIADLSLLSELTEGEPTRFTGTAGLAQIVMYVATEPWRSRARARYELMLLASRDPELAATIQLSTGSFYTLARDAVTQWQSTESPSDATRLDDQAIAALALINGVMMTIVAGQPVVDSAEHLDRLLRGVIAGVAGITAEEDG